jgi:hypothetical protein
MIFVQITSAMQGTGEVIARGCAEVDVVSGQAGGERIEVPLVAVN